MDAIQLKRFDKCRNAIELCVKGWEHTLEDIATIAVNENDGEAIKLNYDDDDNRECLVFMEIPCDDCDEPYLCDYLYVEDGKVYVEDSQYGFVVELAELPLMNQCAVIERAIEKVGKKD